MSVQSFKTALHALSCLLIFSSICLAQTTERVNLGPAFAQGDYNSHEPDLSADGNYVAFESEATNLVANDTNGLSDIFVRDRQTGVVERVSVDSSDLQSNHRSHAPSISADGRYVAFESHADNLVANDTNASQDIFVHDRQTGITERVSVNSVGIQSDHNSFAASISADGFKVSFISYATNLVANDTNDAYDAFVHDLQTGITQRVSVDSLGLQGNGPFGSSSTSISATGRYVAFAATSDNLVPNDTNGHIDIFVRDTQTNTTERVSVGAIPLSESDGNSYTPVISANGRYVAFQSDATNLVFIGTAGFYNIFVHDRQTGTTERVSVNTFGVQENFHSHNPSISDDGRYVAFGSTSTNLAPEDTNGAIDIFVHDRQTGITERASLNSLGDQAQLNNPSYNAALSGNGRYVAFDSFASNLVSGDTNSRIDIFVRDRWNGLGANSIYLDAPATSPALAPVNFSWQATRGSSQYWLVYSAARNGSVFGGHNFDVGPAVSVIATGVNALNGTANFITAPVPANAAGHTFYFEVAARDGGVLYDSNVRAVTFY